jgi:isopentenyl diphosphate isomerase/L-lactate dehydrogenase-like FMN-dependent dehydrogenase
MNTQRTNRNRRALLAGLLALPAAAILPLVSRAQAAWVPALPPRLEGLLNVADFESAARAVLPPAHFGYLATGVDDDRTVAWNHEAYGQLEISVRRFADVSRTDLGVDLCGMHWPSPVYLSAVGGQRAFHPEAELATAHAAASRSALMMLSAGGSTGPEDVMAARGAPVWQQIYPTDDWEVTRAIVERAQRAGCSAIVLTVDNHWPRYNETLARAMRADPRTCTDCHANNSHDFVRKAPIYRGVDVSRVKESTQPSAITWEYLDRVRGLVKGKLLIKGIMRGDEAAGCARHGADGVIVSNHGGRDEESLRSTIECLPEVVAACSGRVPVLVDGGVRRGTDVFKALALGASAVGIGRPQIWGLAPYGQAGVEAILDIYTRELRAIMRQAGTPSVASITRDFVIARVQAPR